MDIFKSIVAMTVIFLICALIYFAWPLAVIAALGWGGYIIYRKSTAKARNTV